jgi:Icc-related predicted phosphoesterase
MSGNVSCKKERIILVYVTGDMHGEICRFESKNIRHLKKNDTIIICGDFGFIWDGGEKEHRTLQQLGNSRFSILFLDGKHENFDLLNKYEIKTYNWGRVRHICGRLYHALRGEIYMIDGKTFFAFGGGESPDKDMRIKSGKWWKEEMPSIEVMLQAKENLNKIGEKVDYILTHEPPAHIKNLLEKNKNINPLNTFFDFLSENVTYKKWFFGCLHVDQKITSKHVAVFNDLIALE